jgi:hypothetical protein
LAIKKSKDDGHQRLMPVIPAIWEAEIGRIMVLSQPGQMVLEIPFPIQPKQKGLEVWFEQ